MTAFYSSYDPYKDPNAQSLDNSGVNSFIASNSISTLQESPLPLWTLAEVLILLAQENLLDKKFADEVLAQINFPQPLPCEKNPRKLEVPFISSVLKDGKGPKGFSSIAIDSRTLRPGALFIAISGPNNEGHSFIKDVFIKGAQGAIILDKRLAFCQSQALDLFFIPVSSTQEALYALARQSRNRTKACIGAITGSVGKTSTKEQVFLGLQAQGKAFSNPLNYNNQWGVPLSLSNLPRDADFGIFEIGTNNPGEILPLSQLVRPHVAAVTTIGPSHIGHFVSLKALAEEKASIYLGLDKNSGLDIPPVHSEKISILSPNTPYWDILEEFALKGHSNLLYFNVPYQSGLESAHEKHHKGYCAQEKIVQNHLQETLYIVKKENISWDSYIGKNAENPKKSVLERYRQLGLPLPAKITIELNKKRYTYCTAMGADHYVHNSLCALSMIYALGGSIEKALPALESFLPIAGRGEFLALEGKHTPLVLIDDSYNASVTSIKAAIDFLEQCDVTTLEQSFRAKKNNRSGELQDPNPSFSLKKMVVIGQMVEQGKWHKENHKKVLEMLAQSSIDYVWTYGQGFRDSAKGLGNKEYAKHFESYEDLEKDVLEKIQIGGYLMVKGSNSLKLSRLVEMLKISSTNL
jgi:UDP-N-acetylmuramoyl-tripeptide--D-alanyl-D-alanine ligase